MKKAELISKYTALSKKADSLERALRGVVLATRKENCDPESGWEELADYEEAKAEHLAQSRIAKIYGAICHDLGDE